METHEFQQPEAKKHKNKADKQNEDELFLNDENKRFMGYIKQMEK